MAKKKTPETVSDLVFDDKNFNKGNPFGEGLIEKSFSKFGAGRSILLDKNNRIIAGNKSTQKFAEGGGVALDGRGDVGQRAEGQQRDLAGLARAGAGRGGIADLSLRVFSGLPWP